MTLRARTRDVFSHSVFDRIMRRGRKGGRSREKYCVSLCEINI